MLNKKNALKLFHKVKSHAHKDAIADFFNKRRKLVFIGLVTIVSFLVVLFLFDLYCKSAQEKYSEIFHQSLLDEERGDIVKAQENLQKIYEAKFAPSGVKGLASLRYAAFLLNADKQDEALKIYLEVANSSRYDNYLRELSGLLAAKILVINIDERSDKTLQEKGFRQIEKFESRSKIFHAYFTEQKAIFALKIGDLAQSYKISDELAKASESPQGLKMRAYDMMKLLQAKGYEVKILDSK